MPPRRKTRPSIAATTPDQESQPKTPTPAAASPEKLTDERILNDPWTDEEEIGLFKGLMHWKPTGVHKHFRLIALYQWLLDQQYINPRNAHTKPAGIWAKLNTLYDLEALDAREDARQLSRLQNPLLSDSQQERDSEDSEDDADAYSEAANKIEQQDFALPAEEGFDELMWHQRFDSQPDAASPFAFREINLAPEPPLNFTPLFSTEPSDAPTPASRSTRGRGRGRGARSSITALPSRRSARQAESTADENEGESQEGQDDEDDVEEAEEEEQEEEQEEEDSSSEEEKSQASTPAPRSTRAKPGRGRGGGRRRGRARRR